MSALTDSEIERLTYTQASISNNYFYLDKLLNDMPPPASFRSPMLRQRSLGELSRLPAEPLLEILESLAIPELMRFRHCSRAAASLVNTNTLLHTALRFVPNVLKAIMALRLTITITPRELQRTLKQRYCDVCEQPAQYIYLPTFERSCLKCINYRGLHSFGIPKADWELSKHCELEPADHQPVPSFHFLAATFTNGMNSFKIPRHTLYDSATSLD
jgi:hypothetical protein